MAKNLVNGSSTTIEQDGNNISVQINFPIGYIYMSTSSTDPATYFGGVWQRIAKGRTLVGVNENDNDFISAELTGGEKTHTLTTEELASHSHIQRMDYGESYNWHAAASLSGSITGACVAEGTDVRSGKKAMETVAEGGGHAHNNLQPYFTCYIWEKVGE